MRRGEVYTARLDPIEGSEQAGTRPVVIVSRDGFNDHSLNVVAVPFTTFRGRRLAPSHVLVVAGDGGLTVDSVALVEHLRDLSKSRLGRLWGVMPAANMQAIDSALLSLLALDG